MFKLPKITNELLMVDSDDESEEDWYEKWLVAEHLFGSSSSKTFNEVVSYMDTDSKDFKNIPYEIQHEMLLEIRDIRDRRRTRYDPMPSFSDNFSKYQLSGLIAKHDLSKKIRGVERAMKKKASEESTIALFSEAERVKFEDQRVSIKSRSLTSDENTRFVLIQGLDQKKKEEDQKDEVKKPAEFWNDHLRITDDVTDTQSNHSCHDDDKNENKLPTEAVAMKTGSDDVTAVNSDDVINDMTSSIVMETDTSEDDFVEVDDVTFDWQTSYDDVTADQDVIKQKSTDDVIEEVKENLKENKNHDDVTENLQSNDDVTESLQNHDDVTENSQSRDDVIENLQNHDDVTKKSYADDDVNKNSLSHDDVTEESYAHDDVTGKSQVDDDVTGESQVDDDVTKKSQTHDDVTNELQVEESGIEDAMPIPHSSIKFDIRADNDLQVLDQIDEDLMKKMESARRNSNHVTNKIVVECQQLLRLFGIPYIISPQEAEAQCAFLNEAGVTCGTITDDSDVWLFGTRQVVYRNFFDSRRDPVCYKSNIIKSHLGLDRSRLIALALCSGCDYTSGIEGVGIVRALEILKEFREDDSFASLRSFKDWWKEQQGRVGREKGLRAQLQRLSLRHDFPSSVVIDAFLNPVVDRNLEAPQWGIPDLEAIRDFSLDKLKWNREKVDERLLPVLRKISGRSRQLRITNFTKIRETRNRRCKSKRVEDAISALLPGNQPPTSGPVLSESSDSDT